MRPEGDRAYAPAVVKAVCADTIAKLEKLADGISDLLGLSHGYTGKDDPDGR